MFVKSYSCHQLITNQLISNQLIADAVTAWYINGISTMIKMELRFETIQDEVHYGDSFLRDFLGCGLSFFGYVKRADWIRINQIVDVIRVDWCWWWTGGWLGKEKHHEAHPITEVNYSIISSTKVNENIDLLIGMVWIAAGIWLSVWRQLCPGSRRQLFPFLLGLQWRYLMLKGIHCLVIMNWIID